LGATGILGTYELIEGRMSGIRVRAIIGSETDACWAGGGQSQILPGACPKIFWRINLLVVAHELG
jgi:hypothetical protein